MFKKLRKTALLVIATANVFLLNMVTFATGDVDAPTLTEVKAIVNDGLMENIGIKRYSVVKI